MINAQPLPMATYSKKHHWYMSIDPMKALYDHLAHEIKTEMDKEIIKACMNVKDGTK